MSLTRTLSVTHVAIPVACLLAASSLLEAQRYPQGPEFQVNVFQQSFQGSASVASDAAGNFVVAWVGPYIDGDYFAIGARRFDKLGKPLGGDFQVNTYTTGSQAFPQVAMTPTGEFVVVWTDYGRDGSSEGLTGQLFDGAGASVGGEFAVNVFTTSRQGRHSVAMGSSGDFVVVWDSYTQDGDQDGIFGRHFDSSGAPLSGEFQVNTFTTGRQYSPFVAADGAGRFVVVWSSFNGIYGGGALFGTYGKVIGSDGLDLTGDFPIGAGPAQTRTRPVVAADPTKAFVVAWSGGSDGSGPAILARRFDKFGQPLTGQLQVNTYTVGNQLNPSIVADPAGGFTVIWENGLQDGSGSGIFGRNLDSSGSPVGSEFQVNTYTYQNQRYAALDIDAEGDFIVVWEDDTLDGSLRGVFGRLFFGPVTCSLGETDGDGVCENLDNCPGLYNPGQDDADADSVGDLCDVTLTSPLDTDILDCSDPAAIQPTFTWSTAAFDRFKVSMGSSPGFEKGTVVSSGDRLIQTGSYSPPRKKWISACKKALAANPISPVMFIKVFGKDRDLPKSNPGRTTFSETVQVGITG